jgi:adenylate cyclase
MLAVLPALVGVHLLDAPVLQQVRHRAFDALQRIRPADYPDALPVRIVAIDEQSLAELGQWPWPRTRLAELVQRLRAQGAALTGFKIVFPDADRLSGERLAESPDLPPALRAKLAERPSNDRVFAETLAAAPTVLGVGLSDAPAGADERKFLYPLSCRSATTATPDSRRSRR